MGRFYYPQGKIIAREHAKMVQNQKKLTFDDKLHTAQIPASLQIDNRVDNKLADLDAKVKSIIKDTVKSQSIKMRQYLLTPLFSKTS